MYGAIVLRWGLSNDGQSSAAAAAAAADFAAAPAVVHQVAAAPPASHPAVADPAAPAPVQREAAASVVFTQLLTFCFTSHLPLGIPLLISKQHDPSPRGLLCSARPVE